MAQILSENLMETISFYDSKAEDFYHGMVLGFCAMLNNNYRITSNCEAGEGRYDVQLLPLRKQLPGILIELKAGKDLSEAQLEDLSKVALQQINDRAYSVELQAMKVSSVVKMGLAFSGKHARISVEQQELK